MVTVEKLMIGQIAASLAGAVISNLPDDLAVDVDIAKDPTKAQNLMGARIFHIYYDFVNRAMGDDKAYPPPAVVSSTVVPGAAGAVIDLVTKSLASGPLAALVPLATNALKKAIETIGKDALAEPAIPPNLPTPGDAAAAAGS